MCSFFREVQAETAYTPPVWPTRFNLGVGLKGLRRIQPYALSTSFNAVVENVRNIFAD
jgi:hypothetical protein